MQINCEWFEESHTCVFGHLLVSLHVPTSCAVKFSHPSTPSLCPFLILQTLSYICWQSLLQLEGPKLTGHFQVLKDISGACARWHWFLFPVGETPVRYLKISLILIHACVEEMKKLPVSPVYIKCMILFSKLTYLYWGNLVEPSLVWKCLSSAISIQTYLQKPQLKCLFLWLLISLRSGVRFQKKESNFSLTL